MIDANQAGGNGYDPAPQVRQTVTISPAPLTITASSPTMTYGGNPPVITPIYSGFVAGDSPASLATRPQCTTDATSDLPLGALSSSGCSGAADPNYQITYVHGLVTVILGNYVSMGDSYSSGEGLGSSTYMPGSDTATDQCHRSSLSYPTLLVKTEPLSLLNKPTYVACGGAETRDFRYANHKYPVEEPAQVKALDHGNTTNVVTFTIGGNDVGFVPVIQQCVHEDVPRKQLNGYGCSKSKTLVAQVKARIAALGGGPSAKNPDRLLIISIQELLRQIHGDAKHAAIFVAGYPHLFGSSTRYFQPDKKAPSKYVCKAGSVLGWPVTIDYADAQWINSEVDALNKAIAAAVSAERARMRVTYISAVPDLFATHGLCDSGSPWLYEISATIKAHLPLPQIDIAPGSLHPTQAGQQYGYEVAFAGR